MRADARVSSSRDRSRLGDDDRALLAVLAVLGDTSAIPHLPALVVAAASGNLEDLAPFSVNGGTASFAEALHWSNRCADGWATSDRSAAHQAVGDETGTYLDVFSTTWIMDRCEQIPIKINKNRGNERSAVAVPALVVAGGFDPNQSADWVDELADALGDATSLTADSIGHTASFTPCGRRIVEMFLTNPTQTVNGCDTVRNIRWSSTTR